MATPADGIWGHDADTSSDSDDGVAFGALEFEDDDDDDEEYAPSEASDAGADEDNAEDDDVVDDATIDETLWDDAPARANWERWFERENAKWERQYGLRIDSEAQPLPRARLAAELRRNPWRRLCFFLGFLVCAAQGWLVYQVHSEGATLAEAWTRLEDFGAMVLPSLYSALHEATAVDEYGVDRAIPSDDSSSIKTQDDADSDNASVPSNMDESKTAPDASEEDTPTPDATTAEEEQSTEVEIHDAAATTLDVDDSIAQEAAEDEATVSEDKVEVAITLDGDAALSEADDSLSTDDNTLLGEHPTPDTSAALDDTQDERALETPHELEPATLPHAFDEADAPDMKDSATSTNTTTVNNTEPTAVDDTEPTAVDDTEPIAVDDTKPTAVDDALIPGNDEAAAGEMEPTALDLAPIERALTVCTASLQAMVRANYTDASQSAAEVACDAALVASSPSLPLHQEAWTRQGDRKNLVRDFAGALNDYTHALSVFPSTTSTSLPLKLTSTRWLVLYLDRHVERLRDECEAYLSEDNPLPRLQDLAHRWLQVLASDASENEDDEANGDHRKQVLVETRKMILLR